MINVPFYNCNTKYSKNNIESHEIFLFSFFHLVWIHFFSWIRYPGMDDQSVFWTVIRKSKDPPIHPIGTCRHLESAPTVQLKNGSVTALSTCYLDSCLFSSGMLSDLYVPEYSYGKFYFKYLTNVFILFGIFGI